MRDERLSGIICLFQAHIRAYLMKSQYKKLENQRFVSRLFLLTIQVGVSEVYYLKVEEIALFYNNTYS